MRFLCLFCFCLPLLAWDVPANLSGNAVDVLRADADLERQVNRIIRGAGGAGTVGYAVPIHNRNATLCCGDVDICSLEDDDQWAGRRDGKRGRGTSDWLLVFLRYKDNQLDKLRLYSDNCPVDTGDIAVTWLDGADPGVSVTMLSNMIETMSNESRQGESLLGAIAMHADSSADDVLAGWARGDAHRDVRGAAIFWLGQSRGRFGFEILEELAFSEPDDKVRERVTFALDVSTVPEAKATLMTMAKEDESAEVRGQALLWLARRGGAEVEALIMENLNSGDENLAEKAVFALSQIPDGAGTARLQDLAVSHRNETVRTKALFWLVKQFGAEARETILHVLDNDPSERVQEQAVFALGQIKSEQTAADLADLARNHPSSRLRGKALFWLVKKGGETTRETVLSVLNDTEDGHIMEQAVFALSQIKSEAALKDLMVLAEKHESPKVRGKALFWLAQKAGKKIADQLSNAAENDPDTEVKIQAVFAISRLPEEERIPRLINLARNHKNVEVRKRAFFWLGQSKDPRALALIKETLEEE
ncbi:MAG: HEAT repeat domain-containing protein [Acidobacteriota bacterium]|nr:HEAT repeat domain-containing protein [Acidobacteriota bacterium]